MTLCYRETNGDPDVIAKVSNSLEVKKFCAETVVCLMYGGTSTSPEGTVN